MVDWLAGKTKSFPKPFYGRDYWHLHLYSPRNFIRSKATPFGVRRLCAQTMIDRARHLAAIAPPGESVRVVVALSLPDLCGSQIIVFFGSDYFNTFFSRRTETQEWTQLENNSLIKAWNLQLPDGFSERGYLEETQDEDEVHKGQIWFIGQL